MHPPTHLHTHTHTQAVPNDSAREELFEAYMRAYRARAEERERAERREKEAAYRCVRVGGGGGGWFLIACWPCASAQGLPERASVV